MNADFADKKEKNMRFLRASRQRHNFGFLFTFARS